LAASANVTAGAFQRSWYDDPSRQRSVSKFKVSKLDMPKSKGRKPKAKKVLSALKAAKGSKEQGKKDQVLNKSDLAKPTVAEAGIDKNPTAPKQKWATLRRLFRRQTIDH
jgi:hypothetical protein